MIYPIKHDTSKENRVSSYSSPRNAGAHENHSEGPGRQSGSICQSIFFPKKGSVSLSSLSWNITDFLGLRLYSL